MKDKPIRYISSLLIPLFWMGLRRCTTCQVSGSNVRTGVWILIIVSSVGNHPLPSPPIPTFGYSGPEVVTNKDYEGLRDSETRELT